MAKPGVRVRLFDVPDKKITRHRKEKLKTKSKAVKKVEEYGLATVLFEFGRV